MALAKLKRDLHRTDVLEVVPPFPESPAVPSDRKSETGVMTNRREPAAQKLNVAAKKIARLCGEAVGCVELTFQDFADRARSFSQEIRHSAQRMKNQNPLQAIAIIAAATFVAGIMLRIWRSQKNA
jgi:ElaB/YqjD/DUF883 family membrane-anchored ribosome-binding protein